MVLAWERLRVNMSSSKAWLSAMYQSSVVQAKLTSFKAARLQLRTCLAHHIHLPLMRVVIEGIKSGGSITPAAHANQGATITTYSNDTSAMPDVVNSMPTANAAHAAMQQPVVQQHASGVTVVVHIQLGTAKAQGQQLAAALQTVPDILFTDAEMIAAIGAMHAGSVQAEVVDATPGLACNSSSTRLAESDAPPQQANTLPHKESQALIEVRIFHQKCQSTSGSTPHIHVKGRCAAVS